MSDDQVQAYRNVPVGTSSGLKVNASGDVSSGQLVNVVANDASLATGAVILTYTPSADTTARVTGASCFGTSGAMDAAVVSIVLVSNSASADITIGQWAFGDMVGASAFQHLNVLLEDDDVLELEVVTTDATETADVAIFAIEYS
jgi:hypothetical protein